MTALPAPATQPPSPAGETTLAKFYYEDFTPGKTIEYGPRLITREEIIAFAAQYDPQPMHLDEEAGRNSLLGGLGASG